jgi:hypothetical protein
MLLHLSFCTRQEFLPPSPDPWGGPGPFLVLLDHLKRPAGEEPSKESTLESAFLLREQDHVRRFEQWLATALRSVDGK